MEDYGLPDARPQARRGASRRSRRTCSPRIGHGRITAKPNIARIDGDTVHFVDGSSARDRHDRLVHGLPDHVPVLRRRSCSTARATTSPLFRRVVHPRPARALLHRAGAAARRDHADRRAPVGVDRRRARGQGRAAGRARRCARRSPPRRRPCGAATWRRRATRSRSTSSPTCACCASERGRTEGVRHPLGRGGRGGAAPARLMARVAVVTGAGRGFGARDRAAPGRARLRGALHRHRRGGGGRDRRARGRLRACSSTCATPRPTAPRRGAAAERGPLEVWVNNAGVLRTVKAWEHSDDEVRLLVDVNLLGVIYGLARGGRRDAERRPAANRHIINIGVALGALARCPGLAVYAATKHGVLGFTDLAAGRPAARGHPDHRARGVPGRRGHRAWCASARPTTDSGDHLVGAADAARGRRSPSAWSRCSTRRSSWR